jgi:hypothetical protein
VSQGLGSAEQPLLKPEVWFRETVWDREEGCPPLATLQDMWDLYVMAWCPLLICMTTGHTFPALAYAGGPSPQDPISRLPRAQIWRKAVDVDSKQLGSAPDSLTRSSSVGNGVSVSLPAGLLGNQTGPWHWMCCRTEWTAQEQLD